MCAGSQRGPRPPVAQGANRRRRGLRRRTPRGPGVTARAMQRRSWAMAMAMAVAGCGSSSAGESDAMSDASSGSTADDGNHAGGSGDDGSSGADSGDCIDGDGDGFTDVACGGNDCDDATATIHPQAPDAGWGSVAIAPRAAADADVAVAIDGDSLRSIAVGVEPGVVTLGHYVEGVWSFVQQPATAPRDVEILVSDQGSVHAAFVDGDVVFAGELAPDDSWEFTAIPTLPGGVAGISLSWMLMLSNVPTVPAPAVLVAREGESFYWITSGMGTWESFEYGYEQWRGTNPDVAAYDDAKQQLIVTYEDGTTRVTRDVPFTTPQVETYPDAAPGAAILVRASQYYVVYPTASGEIWHAQSEAEHENRPIAGEDGQAIHGEAIDLQRSAIHDETYHASIGGPALRHVLATQITSPVRFAIETIDDVATDRTAIAATTDDVVDILYWTPDELRHAALRPGNGIDDDCDGAHDG
ncbi:MAG: hypothetical protein K1X88_00855 [Nannocystaceae bacterium]|nr:hypothetical protein [Nannocystaceae bacterium]